MKLKNIIVILSVFLFVFCLTTVSKADTTYPDYSDIINDYIENLNQPNIHKYFIFKANSDPDNHRYLVSILYSGDESILSAPDSDFVYLRHQGGYSEFYLKVNKNFSYYTHNAVLDLSANTISALQTYLIDKNSSDTFYDPDFHYHGVILESQLDIYDYDTGSVFFPKTPTPTPTVEEIIAEETPKMGEKVIQAMKIILLCGVGCLALLIGLPILLKVLYRFL